MRSPLLAANRSCAPCHPYNDEELKARVINIQDRHFALMSRAGAAAVNMIDAIVAVRKPYDERNRPAAAARAKEALEKKDGFAQLPKEEQEKKIAAETKANLLTLWREAVAKAPPSPGSASCSGRPSGGSTSWPRRTPWGSTPRRRTRGSWPSRSTCPGRRRSWRRRSWPRDRSR